MRNRNGNGQPGPERDGGGKEATDAIGRQLKAIYESLLNEPVPERLLDILKRLDDPAGNGKDTPPLPNGKDKIAADVSRGEDESGKA